MLSILEHLPAVHEHVPDTGSVLVGTVKGGVVGHPVRIKDHDIRKISLLQSAAPVQLQVGSRKRGDAPDGFLQGDDSFLPNVFPQKTGKGAVGAGSGVPIDNEGPYKC